MEPAISFDDVVKVYGPTRALDGVSFEVGKGETVALLGPNGAGKSTAVGIVLGLLAPDRGRARVLGAPPKASLAAGRVGAMLQSAGLPIGATVTEVVDLVRRLYPRPLALAELLALADLTNIAGRKVDGLSGGQAQRVRFATAIAGDPELVFLDEPTVAMDVESRRAFWDATRAAAARGRTTVFATHYLEEAESVADRIIVLAHGRVVADGPATSITSIVKTKTVRFTLPGLDQAVLRSLPGVEEVIVHGDGVTLRCSDADAAVYGCYRAGLAISDLEVSGAGLEEAFLALVADSPLSPAEPTTQPHTAHTDTAHTDTAHTDTAHTPTATTDQGAVR
jgi:ABC-2 type transport system ATP-binding protein